MTNIAFRNFTQRIARLTLLAIGFLISSTSGLSNVAADGTGPGPNVTVTDNGDTVTMANGIASIVIVKKTGRLNSVAYTYNNDGRPQTSETLSGNGQYYYGGFSLGSGVYEYSLATDPASNGGNYADAKLLSVDGRQTASWKSISRCCARFARILFHRHHDAPQTG